MILINLDKPYGSICAKGTSNRYLYHIEFVLQTYRIFERKYIDFAKQKYRYNYCNNYVIIY